MTFEEVMVELKESGTDQNIKIYKRHGAGDNLFGVSFANLNKLKKKIKFDSELAKQLWKTQNVDAQTLATMILKPAEVNEELIEEWMAEIKYHLLVDLLMKNVVSKMEIAIPFLEQWTASDDEWYGRAGWTLLAHLAMNDKELEDHYFENYISTVENTIHNNINRKREAMNSALIAIGGRSEALKKRCQDVAKKIGVVEVDHGETSCKTSDAYSYIEKIWARKK